MTQLPEEAIEEIARTVSPHLWDGRLLGALWRSKHFTHDQAVQSVARKQGEAIEDTQRFLAAAYPAIEKQVRAEVAAEIREAISGLIKISREIRPGLYERDIRYEGQKDAYTHAARIAEGGK